MPCIRSGGEEDRSRRREKGGVHTTIQTYVSATARLLILEPPLSQLLECAPHG